MTRSAASSDNLVPKAAAFEGSLALAGVALGWLFGTKPLATLTWDPLAIAWGTAATLPMFAVLFCIVWLPWGPFARLLQIVDEMIQTFFRGASLFDLAVVALMAGIGEEVLFRGFVQAGLVRLTGSQMVGLIGAGVLFGLVHAITRTYAILATVVGIYLGLLWIYSGNLLAPILAHAIYDFGALWYLQKRAARAVTSV
jgi:membrane protease YdiL (CAAX protease family)